MIKNLVMDDESDLHPFDERIITDPFPSDGGEANEDTVLSLPNVFTGDRKSFPYMISPENLKKPIKEYVRFRNQMNPGMTELKFVRDMGKKLNDFSCRYVQKNKTFKYTEKETHVNLGGGYPLGIPPEKEDEFLEVYANFIKFGSTSWLVERPTIIMKMIMDFDFKQKDPLTFHEIEVLAYIVQSEVKKFFPECEAKDPRLDVIVSTNVPQIITLDKTSGLKGVKSGVHMHWGFYADKKRSLDLRENFKAACIKNAGKRTLPKNSWDDVMDLCIYSKDGKAGSGLRLMGADKAVPCKACDKRKKEDTTMCEVCFDKRAINEGRPYHALFVMDSEGNRNLEKEKEYKLDFFKLVKDTKIRTNFTEIPIEPLYKIPDGAQLYQEEDDSNTNKRKSKKIIIENGKKKRTPQKDKDLRGLNISISNSDREWDAIEDLITMHSLPVYKNVYVSKITTDSNRKSYFVEVKGENCRYCHNISREHSSNRIYFLITMEGMVQRCYDNSEQTLEMKHGPCHLYKSANIVLTQKSLQVLFKRNELLIEGKKTGKTSGVPDTDAGIDKKLKMLIVMGNELCKNLYGVHWITENDHGEILLAKENGVKRPKKDMLLSMEHTFSSNFSLNVSKIDGLGSKTSEILLKLGFLEKEPQRKMSIDQEDEENLSISELETMAFTTLHNIVEICCMMSKDDFPKLNNKNFSYFYK